MKGNFKPIEGKEGHYGKVYLLDICPYRELCKHNQDKCFSEAHKECSIYKEFEREKEITGGK